MVSVYLLTSVSALFFTSQQTVTVELYVSKCNSGTTVTYLTFNSYVEQRSLLESQFECSEHCGNYKYRALKVNALHFAHAVYAYISYDLHSKQRLFH